MNLFGVGLPEMAVILVVGLLIFGPRKLPEIGRTVAKTIKSLQSASKEFEAELRRETSNLDKPAPKPVAAIEATSGTSAAASNTSANSDVTDNALSPDAATSEATAEIITETEVVADADSLTDDVSITDVSIAEPQKVA